MTRGSGFGKMLKMERIFGMGPLVILFVVCSVFVSDCSSASSGDQEGYFLFTPPFGGDRPPQEVAASKRSGAGESNDVGLIARASSITPAESLWIGSHKINWGPLPLFQKFLDHHQQKQQQRFAQARKFDPEDHQIQSLKGPGPGPGPFAIGRGSFKDKFDPPQFHQQQQKKPILFKNPHHDFTNKFSTGGFFAGLSAAFGKPNPFNAPPQVLPPKFAEARSSIHPEGDFDFPHGSLPQPQSKSQPTTPIPHEFRSSTRSTMLVSPPGTIAALSTPGTSINPIIDCLLKMTEWSKQSQKFGFSKKEGKPNTPLKRKLRLKKRLRVNAKPHKHNIEAIILAGDDDDVNDSLSVERQIDNKQGVTKKERKSKRKSRGKTGSKEESNNSNVDRSSEEVVTTRAIQLPENDLVPINPTNAAAFLQDPLDVQQTALKHYQLKRKDKKMGYFKNDDATNRAAATPVSFRFGAEPNPYTN